MRPVLVLACLSACTPEPEILAMDGPGFQGGPDLIAPRDGTYVVALTHLQVKNAPGPGKRFGELVGGITDVLYPEQGPYGDVPGWVGASFRNVGKLQWWTMSVWEDEASMMEFVASGPHLLAMTEISDVSAAAEATRLEVTADELPLDWDDALDRLNASDDYTLGEP